MKSSQEPMPDPKTIAFPLPPASDTILNKELFGIEEKPLVTITGVTGFLGSQIAKIFLEDGSYRIRGTVRDCNNAEKIDALKKTVGEQLFSQM